MKSFFLAAVPIVFLATVAAVPLALVVAERTRAVPPDVWTGAAPVYRTVDPEPTQAQRDAAMRAKFSTAAPKEKRDLMARVEIYAGINALADICNLRAADPAAALAALKDARSEPEAVAMAARLHREIRAEYANARDKAEYCHAMLAATFGNAVRVRR
jgi:hypothetical protein